MRISDWSSDVCSSDRLVSKAGATGMADKALFGQLGGYPTAIGVSAFLMGAMALLPGIPMLPFLGIAGVAGWAAWKLAQRHALAAGETDKTAQAAAQARSAEHTSELQSLLRTSYAVFCLKKKHKKTKERRQQQTT